MKKLSSKKIMLILFIVIIIASVSTVSLASLPSMQPQYGVGAGKLQNVAEIVLGAIQVIAVAVATIMLVVLAIKYISASPSEKANIKEGAFIYIVGALLLFAGAGVLKLIESFGSDINSAVNSGTSTSAGKWV